MSDNSENFLRSEVLKACRDGDLEVLAATLASGLSLEGIEGRWSPLLEAVNARQTNACAFILDAGGRPDFSDSTGGTALHWAAQAVAQQDPIDGGARAAEIVQLLASRGASFECANKSGRTPLQVAVIDNSLPTIAALLKSGAPPDYTPSDDRGPLHLAASMGHSDACRMLVTAGANLSLRSDGRTPEEWASYCGHTGLGSELKALRQSLGAKSIIADLARAKKLQA